MSDNRSWIQSRLRRFHIEATGARTRDTYAVVLQETVGDFEAQLDPFTEAEWDAINTALLARKHDCAHRSQSGTSGSNQYWTEQAREYDTLYWKVMRRRGAEGATAAELRYEEKALSEEETAAVEAGQELHVAFTDHLESWD